MSISINTDTDTQSSFYQTLRHFLPSVRLHGDDLHNLDTYLQLASLYQFDFQDPKVVNVEKVNVVNVCIVVKVVALQWP